jgi:hypothetical protein
MTYYKCYNPEDHKWYILCCEKLKYQPFKKSLLFYILNPNQKKIMNLFKVFMVIELLQNAELFFKYSIEL